MGLTNVALQMAKTAMQAQRMGLEVAGNNVSNANNEDYSRRRVRLVSNPDIRLAQHITMGTGVGVSGTERIVDVFLIDRLREAGSECASLDQQRQTLRRIEGIYNELGDSDLSTMMNGFFSAVGDMQNFPDKPAQRQLVVTLAENLTEQFRMLRREIDQARTAINGQFDAAVDTVNSLAAQIAEVNAEIVRSEGGGMYRGSAAALRDLRDGMLRELSSLVTVDVFEQTSGAVEVQVGSHSLVSGGEYYGLRVESALAYDSTTGEWITRIEELDDPEDVQDMPLRYAVFELDSSPLRTEGGMIHGFLSSRDEILAGQAESLDRLVSSFVFEINKLHSEGCGLEFFDDVRSFESVDDADAVLSDAGLAFSPQNGGFNIRVHDLATGQVKTINIQVDLDGIGADDSLNTLVGKINTAMTAAGLNVSATVNADNTLSIASSAADTQFSFNDYTSDVLAALGVNTFFTGTNSANVDVNQVVRDNINLVAAALSPVPDDGSNAARIVDFRSATVTELGGLNIEEFYQSVISELAIDASITASRSDGAAAYRESLLSEREAVSGVSIDEEAINMMRYQRAFQAAARYVTVVDELVKTMLALV